MHWTINCARSLLMLMPALALAIPALAQDRDPRLSDSQEPGSVIVFPKFIRGTVTLPEGGTAPRTEVEIGVVIVFPKFIRGTVTLPEGGTAPRTEVEIGVVCPPGVVCPEHLPIKIRFHWVCPGDLTFPDKLICPETDFDVTATVGEKIVLVPDGSFAHVSNHTVPAAPCPRGYLIGWVIDTSNRPIKFDGLIGDAVLRQSRTAVSSHGAIPIQADPVLANLAPITTGDNGGLVFDGGPGHYLAATGKVRADVKYTNATTGPTYTTDGAGQQLYRAAIEAGVHAVAVELDLVQPLVAFRRRVDELGQLRRDPLRQGRRVWTPRYRPRHAGGGNGLLRRRIRLVEMIDLADMLGMIPLPRSWSHSSSRSRLPPARSRRGNWIALAPPAANVRRCPVGL
jgi:hypothetical protein